LLKKNQDISGFILQKITRLPFRKQPIGDESKENILKAIELKMKKQEKIELNILFGGYKHF
jgi:hypothetical protein